MLNFASVRRAFVPFASGLPLVALAAAMPSLSLADLARRSDVIVHARVLAQTVIAPDGPHSITTHARLQVIRALKGNAPAEIDAVQVGGSWGHYTLLLPGGAKMQTGEEIVAFLRCRRAACALVGLAQGKFRVTSDPRTRRRIAQRDFADEPPRDFEGLVSEIRGYAK
jgi:hypothetical protein